MNDNFSELVATLRQWRTETPDAYILHAADQIERLARDLAGATLHARTLNKLLGAAEDDSNKLAALLQTLLVSAHRNARDYMPAEWHEAVDDGKAYLLARKDGSKL